MDRRLRFVFVQSAGMVGVALGLMLLNMLTLSLFLIVSYIGLLVVIELTAPFAVTPPWRPRLRWLVLLGFSVFTYFVIRQIFAILPTGTI